MLSALHWQVRLSHGGLSPYELAAALDHILKSHQRRDHHHQHHHHHHQNHHHHHHHHKYPNTAPNISGVTGRTNNSQAQSNNNATASATETHAKTAKLPFGRTARADPPIGVGTSPTKNANSATSLPEVQQTASAVSYTVPVAVTEEGAYSSELFSPCINSEKYVDSSENKNEAGQGGTVSRGGNTQHNNGIPSRKVRFVNREKGQVGTSGEEEALLGEATTSRNTSSAPHQNDEATTKTAAAAATGELSTARNGTEAVGDSSTTAFNPPERTKPGGIPTTRSPDVPSRPAFSDEDWRVLEPDLMQFCHKVYTFEK